MNEQVKIEAGAAAISAALAKAQAEMGKALKQTTNPHFRSKYADLGSVMDACLPALNKHGIAVIQPTIDDETGRYVETVFLHDKGETLRCRVPLIVQKNDMQGYGSAVTYARRYGLMCMAGIAPEDDDGNAATAAAPKQQEPDRSQTGAAPEPRDPRKIADGLLGAIAKAVSADDLDGMNADGTKFAAAWDWLDMEHKPMAAEVKAAFDKRRGELITDGDEIPY